ncbi:MAG: hypothetical protein K2X48_14780 [Chitinophagaceae bacterium]|nr:hypothetical protein [Chitinophagaceae bacterium]
MLAKVKPQVFLDSLNIEVMEYPSLAVTAILRDEKGSICRCADYQHSPEKAFTWTGLNDLPYGVYSLELSNGDAQLHVRLVKRV